MTYLDKPSCSLSAQSPTPYVAMAAASSCEGSRVPISQSDTESVASPTAALKRDLEGVEAQLRCLADRQARVEAELLRITCEETFLRRQQRRLLHGIFAAKHGEDADAASSAALRWKLPPAPRRQVFMCRDPRILFLVGLTNLLFLYFWGYTVCT